MDITKSGVLFDTDKIAKGDIIQVIDKRNMTTEYMRIIDANRVEITLLRVPSVETTIPMVYISPRRKISILDIDKFEIRKMTIEKEQEEKPSDELKDELERVTADNKNLRKFRDMYIEALTKANGRLTQAGLKPVGIRGANFCSDGSVSVREDDGEID